MSQEQDVFKRGQGKGNNIIDTLQPAIPDTKISVGESAIDEKAVAEKAAAEKAMAEEKAAAEGKAADTKRRTEISFTRYLETISSERDPEKMVFIDKDGNKQINKVGFEADLSTLSHEKQTVQITNPLIKFMQFMMMLVGLMSRGEYNGLREQDENNVKKQLQAKAEEEGKNQGFLVPMDELQLADLNHPTVGIYRIRIPLPCSSH